MIGIVLSLALAAGAAGSGDDGAGLACAPAELSATTVRAWPAADAGQSLSPQQGRAG